MRRLPTPELRYGIIGRGRWGARIARILTNHSRTVKILDLSRRRKEEGLEVYQERVRECLRPHAHSIDVVWLAVPPGDQATLVKCVLDGGGHVVIEKPWMCDPGETQELMSLASARGLQVAVHHQYCFLDVLNDIQRSIDPQNKDAVFSGEFSVSRGNRLSVPALYNLGSHLLAIRCLLFPGAQVDSIRVGYNSADSRWIRIKSASHEFYVDFSDNKEPLIQRFIDSYEQAIAAGCEFPINLGLALRVRDELSQLE